MPNTSQTAITTIAAEQQPVFNAISADITRQGYSVQPQALPPTLSTALAQQALAYSDALQPAGIGRQQLHRHKAAIRGDSTRWINPATPAQRHWLNWAAALQQTINRQLFLGLREFESHFAHYPVGAAYQRHYDTFSGPTNRKLSLLTYLNQNWPATAGGELVLYAGDNDTTGQRVLPQAGTVVVFLSADFPHEVLPATQGRWSIAGWFY